MNDSPRLWEQQGARNRATNQRLIAFGRLIVLVVATAMTSSATAQEPATNDILPSDKQALEKGTTSNWYSDEGKLVFPSSLSRDFLDARHRSISPPAPPRTFNRNWFSGSFWTMLQTYWLVISITGVLLIVAIILFVLYRNGSYFSGRFRRESSEDLELTAAKISDLPFQLELPVRGLLEEADAARQNRDYSRAIIYLFSYVLVELDRNRRIRLQRGKTNRMYLREIKSDLQLRIIVERVMLAFEWVFFGRHELSEKSFNECWNSLDEFRNRLVVVNELEPMPPVPAAPAITNSGGMV